MCRYPENRAACVCGRREGGREGRDGRIGVGMNKDRNKEL